VRGTSACANTPPAPPGPSAALAEHPGPVDTRTASGVLPCVWGPLHRPAGSARSWVRACGGLCTLPRTPHLLRTPPPNPSPLPSTAGPLSHPSPLAAPSCPSPFPPPPSASYQRPPPKAPLPAQLMSAASSPIALLESGIHITPRWGAASALGLDPAGGGASTVHVLAPPPTTWPLLSSAECTAQRASGSPSSWGSWRPGPSEDCPARDREVRWLVLLHFHILVLRRPSRSERAHRGGLMAHVTNLSGGSPEGSGRSCSRRPWLSGDLVPALSHPVLSIGPLRMQRLPAGRRAWERPKKGTPPKPYATSSQPPGPSGDDTLAALQRRHPPLAAPPCLDSGLLPAPIPTHSRADDGGTRGAIRTAPKGTCWGPAGLTWDLLGMQP